MQWTPLPKLSLRPSPVYSRLSCGLPHHFTLPSHISINPVSAQCFQSAQFVRFGVGILTVTSAIDLWHNSLRVARGRTSNSPSRVLPSIYSGRKTPLHPPDEGLARLGSPEAIRAITVLPALVGSKLPLAGPDPHGPMSTPSQSQLAVTCIPAVLPQQFFANIVALDLLFLCENGVDTCILLA